VNRNRCRNSRDSVYLLSDSVILHANYVQCYGYVQARYLPRTRFHDDEAVFLLLGRHYFKVELTPGQSVITHLEFNGIFRSNI